MFETWYIADTHYRHDNIIRYEDRPQNHEELMDAGLTIVQPQDTLVHLGDVILCKRAEAHEFAASLPGARRILVEGNHDKGSRIRTSPAWDEVHRYREVWEFERDGLRVAISHRSQELKDVTADVKLHGHSHGYGDPYYVVSECENHVLFMNLSVEQWSYTPVSWTDLHAMRSISFQTSITSSPKKPEGVWVVMRRSSRSGERRPGSAL